MNALESAPSLNAEPQVESLSLPISTNTEATGGLFQKVSSLLYHSTDPIFFYLDYSDLIHHYSL